MLERTELDSVSVDIAERLRAGSREALAEAYERWAGLVHAIALRALGHHHDAEDVTQQVFVSAWRSRETIRVGPDALPGWLVGITRHRIADVRAQQARSFRNTAAIAATLPPAVSQPVEDVAAGLFVAHELSHLGEPRQTVVRMFVLEDRSHEEISVALDMPLGTVKSHIRRGLATLRHRLQEVNRAAP